jgi:hypothetical protein
VSLKQPNPGWLVGMLTAVVLALPATAESHVKGCHSRKCDRRISAKRHRLFWVHRFQEKSPWERTWARCISFHESGNRPIARASGHWGYFQWSLATWHAAGGSGNPETHSWSEQAVRAIRWAHIAGSSQWTTSAYCGSV